MTKQRYQELNSLWNTSPIYAIVDAYKSGGSNLMKDAIIRLANQYDAGTYMGSPASAYKVLEAEKATYEEIVANALDSREEYTEYITTMQAEDEAVYECIYMIDFLGSSMFNLLKL